MKITVLSSDPQHPVAQPLRRWVEVLLAKGHEAYLRYDRSLLTKGDLLFLVSCGQIVRPVDRAKFRHTLVLHASDLPRGRGWSPHIWSILNGEHRIVLSLIEADDPVDTGRIWLKTEFTLEGHELLPEINERLFMAEIHLMDQVVEKMDSIRPEIQTGDPGPYLRKRSPSDSQIDPNRTIAEQFDLLRIVDSNRYPAFFDHRGHRYLIKIEKVGNE